MRRQIGGTWSVAVAALVSTLALVGCDTSGGAGANTAGGGTGKTTKTGKEGDHDHDHDHKDGDHKDGDKKKDAGHKHDDEKGHDDHDHAHHGPHGGHIAEVGAEEFHIEWTHDDDGKIAVYILDSGVKKEVGVDQPSITVETKVGDTVTTYELAAVKPSDEAKASKFEIVDKELLGVIETLGEDVKATIKELKIGDKTFTDVKIEEHEHDH